MMRYISAVLLLFVSYSSNIFADFLVQPLSDHELRDYWLPEEVNRSGVLDEFQKVVSGSSVAIENVSEEPISIALIYPSLDVSDFWRRNYISLTKRLDELNIKYTAEEFVSRQIEHARQTSHVDQVFSNEDEYDIVIFGPSDLSTQSKNIERLSKSKQFHTFIWAFHTPMKAWSAQPTIWFDFSSSHGAKTICSYVVERLGRNVTFAMNRGIPGITDQQRSGDFRDCVMAKGDWNVAYEHFGQYQRVGGADGAKLVDQYFPEAALLHNANTAMAVGAVDALQEQSNLNRFYITGWGGTDVELQLIREKKLNATPMRMGDDVGVASAEAVKYILQKRDDQLPRVYLGRITVANDQMTEAEIDDLEQRAFRYSGLGVIE